MFENTLWEKKFSLKRSRNLFEAGDELYQKAQNDNFGIEKIKVEFTPATENLAECFTLNITCLSAAHLIKLTALREFTQIPKLSCAPINRNTMEITIGKDNMNVLKLFFDAISLRENGLVTSLSADITRFFSQQIQLDEPVSVMLNQEQDRVNLENDLDFIVEDIPTDINNDSRTGLKTNGTNKFVSTPPTPDEAFLADTQIFNRDFQPNINSFVTADPCLYRVNEFLEVEDMNDMFQSDFESNEFYEPNVVGSFESTFNNNTNTDINHERDTAPQFISIEEEQKPNNPSLQNTVPVIELIDLTTPPSPNRTGSFPFFTDVNNSPPSKSNKTDIKDNDSTNPNNKSFYDNLKSSCTLS
ncbi:MAG: hypothetical protein HKM04_03150 [Legionellales bacterium]|nr:hypothetical protein [Legionellales bacterium]